jgi:hypothetical protein
VLNLDPKRVLNRPANSGGTWEASSKKEFELQQNFLEHLHNFFVVNHVLVFKFWRTFFKWHNFLWRLKKCACEKAVYSFFFLDLKYVDNKALLW